jgi:hypothetical protein
VTAAFAVHLFLFCFVALDDQSVLLEGLAVVVVGGVVVVVVGGVVVVVGGVVVVVVGAFVVVVGGTVVLVVEVVVGATVVGAEVIGAEGAGAAVVTGSTYFGIAPTCACTWPSLSPELSSMTCMPADAVPQKSATNIAYSTNVAPR